jgi:tRNA pseudouridine55 synthase
MTGRLSYKTSIASEVGQYIFLHQLCTIQAIMSKIICINKPPGLSPLQTIRLLQQHNPKYHDLKIGYAGRLDPLADGLLLLLLGDENKKKKDYEDLPKTYEFEVLFGISTDTYDTLGLITDSDRELSTNNNQLTTMVNSLLRSFIGKQIQSYPPFSSRTVHGKPLYWYAREGKLNGITIPTTEIDVYSLELLSSTLLPNTKLEQTVYERINIVSGNFRQDEIRSSWQSFFESSPPPRFPVLRFRIHCSSGTYVRSLAHNLGERLGIPALAYTITRTAIGSYSLKNALKLEPIA